ncbi:glycosyltransferase [Campylobacter sp. CX2-4080-23]|uniref:CgeB family protein n=1 Tax=Campylobacter porcelli TaxID=1660073 RepID=UPI002EC97F7B|nr:glycosyltransferase [Campylobacter sp. CX2-4080-23]
MVQYAKDLKISTVFWNKEDGVYFDRFIDSAKLFDHIFTVDQNCIPKYRAVVDSNVAVNTLIFAVQSKFHNFSGFEYKFKKANFVGSYSTHIHDKRRYWQDMMFKLSSQILGLDIYDRNSERKSDMYRYPNIYCANIFPSIEYHKTADVYKNYLVSLNVNTIENSPTMFSRRLIEILACGRIAVTNDTPAIKNYFKDYLYSFRDEYELEDILYKINKFGMDKITKDKLKSAAEYIANNHTWSHRIEYIKEIVGIK